MSIWTLLGGVVGAFVLRFVDRHGWIVRERSLLRPFGIFVIAGCACGLPLLYWYEVVLPTYTLNFFPGFTPETWSLLPTVNENINSQNFFRFVVHTFLFTCLLAATLIDCEDRIIPDELTVFGTVVGLSFMWFFPFALLPAHEYTVTSQYLLPVRSLLFWFSPHDIADPFVERVSLIAPSLLIWYTWCFAMLDRRWYQRLGTRRAAILFWRRLYQSTQTKFYLFFALLGTVVIPCGLLLGSQLQAYSLFTSLVGMAFGGGIVWAVRLVARATLRVEAMGFGDVTFMAMIGAFVGWQPALIAFALAPFAGVVVGLVKWFLGYGAAIPFGPFLAAATVAVVLQWCGIWLQTEWFFSLGLPLVLVVLLVCVVLIGIMLAIWYQIKIRLYHLHNSSGEWL